MPIIGASVCAAGVDAFEDIEKSHLGVPQNDWFQLAQRWISDCCYASRCEKRCSVKHFPLTASYREVLRGICHDTVVRSLWASPSSDLEFSFWLSSRLQDFYKLQGSQNQPPNPIISPRFRAFRLSLKSRARDGPKIFLSGLRRSPDKTQKMDVKACARRSKNIFIGALQEPR